MSVKVKGVIVRFGDLRKDLNLEFKDLNSYAQVKLLKENVNLFFYEALMSEFSTVRNLAIKLKKDCSSKAINLAISKIIDCSNDFYDSELVLKLLDTKKLKLNSKLREKLSKTDYLKIRQFIAKDQDTTAKMLKQMLVNEIYNILLELEPVVVISIIQNKNFKWDEKTKEEIKKYCFNEQQYHTVISKIEQLMS